jgi:uncharacterized Ntn-hydrolase superfamily protein
MRSCITLLVLLAGLPPAGASGPALVSGRDNIATFSIAAWDSLAGEWGVAVQSRFLAVGAVVPFARAGAGAAATQAWGNTALGPRALELMEAGATADSALKIILASDQDRSYRQVGLVDLRGSSATYTGQDCQAWAGGLAGEGFCVQGNILAGQEVVEAMARSWQGSSGRLAQRLLEALLAGQEAGGDRRGMQSAALLVVSPGGGYSGYDDRAVDLRVDDHPEPIRELERLFLLHEKTFQAGAYLRRGMEARKRGEASRAEHLVGLARQLALKYGNDHDLLNQVAWEMAVNDYRLDEARELAERAVSLAPEDGNIIDTLAEIFARLGDYRRAIDLEKRAYRLTGNREFREKMESWKKAAKARPEGK